MKGHYDDPSAAIFIPDNFRPELKTTLIFYFHGWHTSVDSSMVKFKLAEQVKQSGKNAILIHPELAKRAADGFGGYLEETNVFKALTEELLDFLSKKAVIKERAVDSIILAGHSGSYRVIAAILSRGGLSHKIGEVFIFDGLYGRNDDYIDWLRREKGRLVNIITEVGGTYRNSSRLAEEIRKSGMPLKTIKSEILIKSDLRQKGNLFIFTQLGHEEVIYPSLRYLLEAGSK